MENNKNSKLIIFGIYALSFVFAVVAVVMLLQVVDFELMSKNDVQMLIAAGCMGVAAILMIVSGIVLSSKKSEKND